MDQYLEECLDSILGQTIDNKEIICIDDGSTDDTSMILERYKEIYSEIKVIKQNRQGAGIARNNGIKQARGKYVAFMDGDDYYATDNALEKLYKGAILNEVNVAGGRMIAFREGKIIRNGLFTVDATCFDEEKIIEYREYQKINGYLSFIYNRSFLIENEILFPDFTRFQDPPFMLKALSTAGTIWVTNLEIYVYRQSDKVVDMKSEKVVFDMVYSFLYMASYAKDNNLDEVLWEVLKLEKRYEVYLFIHIFYGNTEMYNLVRKLDSCFSVPHKEHLDYHLDMTEEEIHRYISEYIKEMNVIFDRMKKAKKMIIYGAGTQGRKLYSVIRDREDVNFIGFAVSHSNPSGTAGGVQIKCISDYSINKKETLVVIAARNLYLEEMRDKAEECGFSDICIVSKDVVNIEEFRINQNHFAV